MFLSGVGRLLGWVRALLKGVRLLGVVVLAFTGDARESASVWRAGESWGEGGLDHPCGVDGCYSPLVIYRVAGLRVVNLRLLATCGAWELCGPHC